MSVLRRQFLRQVVVSTAAAPSVTLVDIVGPESAQEAPYAEGTDYVTRPRQSLQNNAGWVVVDGWDGSSLATANLTVDVEIWSRATVSHGRNIQAPLFPNGGGVATDPVLKRVVATGVPGNSAALVAILGGEFGGDEAKDKPALYVNADEFIRLRLTATTGGALGPVTLSAKFDFGQHPSQA